jgi:hypothetical protein
MQIIPATNKRGRISGDHSWNRNGESNTDKRQDGRIGIGSMMLGIGNDDLTF